MAEQRGAAGMDGEVKTVQLFLPQTSGDEKVKQDWPDVRSRVSQD